MAQIQYANDVPISFFILNDLIIILLFFTDFLENKQ